MFFVQKSIKFWFRTQINPPNIPPPTQTQNPNKYGWGTQNPKQINVYDPKRKLGLTQSIGNLGRTITNCRNTTFGWVPISPKNNHHNEAIRIWTRSPFFLFSLFTLSNIMDLRHQWSAMCIIMLGGDDTHPWSATKVRNPIPATIPVDH